MYFQTRKQKLNIKNITDLYTSYHINFKFVLSTVLSHHIRTKHNIVRVWYLSEKQVVFRSFVIPLSNENFQLVHVAVGLYQFILLPWVLCLAHHFSLVCVFLVFLAKLTSILTFHFHYLVDNAASLFTFQCKIIIICKKTLNCHYYPQNAYGSIKTSSSSILFQEKLFK